MDFDDKQDANEAQFESTKEDLLGGMGISDIPRNTSAGKGYSKARTIDDVLTKMYFSDITSYESLARFDQGVNMMERQIAHVRHLSVMDYGDAEDEHKKLLLTTVGDWLIKAFRKDSDFVDEAVTHIMEGTAAAFFE